MSIANDVVLNIVKSRYIENINSIVGRVQGLNNLCTSIRKDIDIQVRDFTPTLNIDNLLNDYNTDLQGYIINVDKPYSDGSNIISGINHAFQMIECLRDDEDFLDSLGISQWEEVTDLSVLPSNFINSISNTVLGSISARIVLDFPYPEFKIGSYLACISSNIKAFELAEYLTELVSIIDCLRISFNLDYTNKQTKVNSLLNQIYVDTSGNIDYSKFSSLSSVDIDNIRNIQRTTAIILNNTKNNLNQTLGSTQQKIFIRNNI